MSSKNFGLTKFSIDRRVDQIENAIASVADRIEEVMKKLDEVEREKVYAREHENDLLMQVK